MDNILRLEQIAIFGFALFLFSQTTLAWWWFPLLILVPDLSMVGYLGGPRSGAILYNIFHHQALAILVIVLGHYFKHEWLYVAGVILLAHAAMDRIFGYGLKYPDSFSNTHLGWIGKKTS
jgi:hypothetical protein